MRFREAAAVLLGVFCFAAAGRAQTIPNSLMAGQVSAALAYGGNGWCAVTQGGGTIQRDQSAGIAVISFPELTLFDGTTYYLLNGQAHMGFTTGKVGSLRFKQTPYPTAINTVPFSGFSESTNGERYTVHFSITFSTGCVLPITAIFETP